MLDSSRTTSFYGQVTPLDRRWLIAAAALTILTGVTGAVRYSVIGTHSWTFLVKNLALAWIPGIIAYSLLRTRRLPAVAFIGLLGIWLAFLPNAPYIVTDAIHLATPRRTVLWLDVLIIGSAALAGLLLTFASIEWTLRAAAERLARRTIPVWSYFAIAALAALGVYFGRFARWNSWEIVTAPDKLFVDFTARIASSDPWLFTLIFGGCLVLGQYVFRLLAHPPAIQRPPLAAVQVEPNTSE